MICESLIIGPGSAFGHQLCLKLLESGKVFAVGRENSGLPPGIIKYNVDINTDNFEHVINEILKNNNINLIIYSAKYSPRGGINVNVEEFSKSINVNATGIIRVLKILSAIQRSESITFIAIGGGYKDVPHPDKVALSASKAVLHNIILALQDECLESKINLHELIIDGRVEEGSKIGSEDVVRAVISMEKEGYPSIKRLP